MRTLDRYILGEYLKALGLILAVVVSVLVLNEMLSTLGEVLLSKPGLWYVVLYLVYSVPPGLYEILPVTAIIAMMFSVGMMAKRKELLAIHASGIGYLRVAMPLIGFLVVFTMATYLIGEFVLPYCARRAEFIEEVRFKGKKAYSLTRNRNITTKGKGNRFYTLKSFESSSGVMEHPTILDVADDGRNLRMRIDAAWGLPVRDPDAPPRGENESQVWRFHHAVRFRFDEDGRLVDREEFDSLDLTLEPNTARYLDTSLSEESMSFSALHEAVEIQGERLKSEYYLDLKTALHAKLAFPLASLLLGLIGYTFAVRSSIRSLVLEFGLALVSIVVFYALIAVGERLGRSGMVAPAVAGWMTTACFVVYLVWRVLDVHRVPRH